MPSTSSTTANTLFFSTLSTDLLLEVVSYCDLEALTHLRASSRLWTVLVAEHEQSHPNFTTMVGALSTLTAQAKSCCSATPSVGFLFSASGSGPAKLTEALRALPSDCQVIGGGSPYPFTGYGKMIVRAGGPNEDVVLSLLSLPEAHAHVFMAENGNLDAANKLTGGRNVVRENILGLDPNIDYKMFVIIPGQGAGHVELLLQALQEGYPHAAIVGGVFSSNVFCWKGGVLQMPGGGGKNRGIVGMALWGNVPLQAVVSRGVVPRSPALKVADWEYDGNGEVIMVKSIFRPASSSSSSSAATGEVMNPYTIFQEGMGDDDPYIGLQIEAPLVEGGAGPGAGGGGGGGGGGGETMVKARHAPYELLSFEFALHEGSPVLLLFFANKPQPPPANGQLAIRFFELTTPAAQTHVQRKMKAVAEELRQKKQEVLGALLFSCNGRGPRRFLGEAIEHFDALMFMNHFPETCVNGIYAMGEIGPQATYVDDDDEEVEGGGGKATSNEEEGEEMGAILRNSQSGSCALQGFTAVFAFLVTPKRSTASSPLLTALNTEGLAVAVRSVLEWGRGGGGLGGGGAGPVSGGVGGGGGGSVGGTAGSAENA